MSRIIAGAAGSLGLKVPQGNTRPTSERVREAIFSSLEHRVNLDGAHVLDLYAGSGALGFEALSRGAVSLIAVDQDRRADQALRANASTVSAALPWPVSIDTKCQTVDSFLKTPPHLGDVDVVFIDPPYEVPNETISRVVETLTERAPHALVIVERSTKMGTPDWPEGAKLVSEKTYGDTQVFTLELSR